MVSKEQLKKLVGNIVNGYRISNCRICLQEIEDEYLCFDDFVMDSTGQRPLSELLSKLFGEEICDLVQGIDCICTNCVEKVLDCWRFMAQCSASSSILNKVFDNLNIALDQNFKPGKLYINISEQDTIIVDIESKTKKNKGQPKFNCTDCDEALDTFEEVQEHNLINHGIQTCKICKDTYIDDHVCSKNVQCATCNALFRSKKTLQTHIDNVHTKYICSECGKLCSSRESLAIHEKTHNNKKHECPSCGKVYLTASSYEKHADLCSKGLIEKHPRRSENIRDFACDKCEKKYSTEGGLRVHKRFAHGNAKPHVCEHCGKKFTAPSCLKTHLVKHTRERNFECTICKHKFVSKEALLYHTRRHTGEKPYSCKLCSEKFVNASARADHIRYKHNEPKHECHICNRRYVDPVYLKKHISKHSDRKSTLYSARMSIPPNVPGIENMRVTLW